MPYRRVETYTTTGAKTSWNLDYSIAPFNAAINITLTGTATYALQYTLDPLDSPTAVDTDAVWLDSPDIPTGTPTSATTSFLTPVARVRLNIAAISGSLKMEAIQGLSTN